MHFKNCIERAILLNHLAWHGTALLSNTKIAAVFFFFVFASVFLCHYSTILRHVHAFSNAKQANIVWTGHAVCSVTFAKILFIHVGLVNSHQFWTYQWLFFLNSFWIFGCHLCSHSVSVVVFCMFFCWLDLEIHRIWSWTCRTMFKIQ